MSRENVELVRQVFDAFARGDFDTSLNAYAEDTTWDDTQYRPDGAVHRGRGGVAKLVRTWRGTWDQYAFTVEDLHDAGDETVVAVLRETARGKGGGVEVTTRFGQVITSRRGEIAHTMVYGTSPTPGALRLRGLEPGPDGG